MFADHARVTPLTHWPSYGLGDRYEALAYGAREDKTRAVLDRAMAARGADTGQAG